MPLTHLLRDGFPACGVGLTGERVAMDRNPGQVTCNDCLEVAKGKRKPVAELEGLPPERVEPVVEPKQFE